MNSLSYELAFTSNGDAVNTMILGKDIETWLVYTLIFLGFTLISFLWVWFRALFRDVNSGKSIKQPWE